VKIPKTVKCDCGHYAKDHFIGAGCCSLCGCTWHHPNTKWIKQQPDPFDPETFDGDRRSLRFGDDEEY